MSFEEHKASPGEMIQQLETLDFKDVCALIGWLDKFEEKGFTAEVADGIIKLFEVNGYQADVNTGDDFNGEDRENFARYLIGQALNNLATIRTVSRTYSSLAEQWRKKFDIPTQKTPKKSYLTPSTERGGLSIN
jgi:hypothetical protein